MKYIDAERLKCELEKRLKNVRDYMNGAGMKYKGPKYYKAQGKESAYDALLSVIDSLQQEPRFPQYDNIVEKVFGAGNLEFWERDEAEMLVALAKEELLKSLQQKQPDFPTTDEQMKEFLATHPKVEVPEKYKNPDWLFKKQEQPEVDLEKFTEKMDAWKARYNYPNNIPIKAAMAFTARMFYQYPNVARQWYDSLPKATMD